MKIAVQMDEPHRLNPKGDSTIVLLREAHLRGYEIYYYHATTLCWKDNQVQAPLQRLHIHEGKEWFSLEEAHLAPLHTMNAVLMRQDPPFDMHYITATYFLDRVGGQTVILNNPTSVRSHTEKMLPLDYAQAMPDTLITPDHLQIREFLAKHKDIILKPLYGWGGHDVLRLREGGDNVSALLEMLSERDGFALIAQPFLPEVHTDDIRVVMLHGHIAGAFTRTPTGGEVRANMRVGGVPRKVELNIRQQALCERIAPKLAVQGLSFAGLDLIGDFLTEINVTSPTGLKTLEDLYDNAPASMFWDGAFSD